MYIENVPTEWLSSNTEGHNLGSILGMTLK